MGVKRGREPPKERLTMARARGEPTASPLPSVEPPHRSQPIRKRRADATRAERPLRQTEHHPAREPCVCAPLSMCRAKIPPAHATHATYTSWNGTRTR